MQAQTERIITSSQMPVDFHFPQMHQSLLPCVVLMHERYGLVEHTGDLARAISSEGYLVATPDLFHYIEDQDQLHKGNLKASPSDPFILGLLDEVVDELKKFSEANADKLAMIGVCQTGRYSVIYGAKRALDASIVLYGATSNWERSELNPEPMDEIIAQLQSPFLGIYGEADHTIPIESVIRLRNTLEANDKTYRIKIFEDSPHGWLNSTMPGRYRKTAAQSAMYEIVKFLKQNLSQTSLRPNRVVWEFESDKDKNYDFSKNARFE